MAGRRAQFRGIAAVHSRSRPMCGEEPAAVECDTILVSILSFIVDTIINI
jgi:hypothetical protein